MSSSSQRGALTRRLRRRQPLRRCKRFRGNPGGGPFLTDLHEPVLRHILEFTMWEDEENNFERLVALWKWTGELGIVCQVFRRLARHVAPDKLFIVRPSINETSASLLRSLQENPWKKTNLVEIDLRSTYFIGQGSRFPGLFLPLFETPDAFPNLNKLTLKIWSDGPVEGFDGDFLLNLAQSCPLLSELYLQFPLQPMEQPISEEQFGSFGQMLQRPLHTTLHLQSASWMTGAHLDAFLRHQGQSLTEMQLNDDYVTDDWLVHAAQHCRNLEKFGLYACCETRYITTGSLRTVLQANPSLRELGMNCYTTASELTFIDILVQHAPQLEKLHVHFGGWFTNDLLDRLVQGQIDYWTDRREPIRLVEIDASYTCVTRDGADRVLAKRNVGRLQVQLLG